MESIAALLNIDENGTEDTGSQQPSGRKRKKNIAPKKTQARIAEEHRQLVLKQRQELLKETKRRIQQEWEENEAKSLVFRDEYYSKLEKLEEAFELLNEFEDSFKERRAKLKEEEKWDFYVKGGLITDMTSKSQINTYLYVWKEVDKDEQMSHCLTKVEEMIQLLEQLEKQINDPPPELTPNAVEDLKELQGEMRRLLQERIDRATFYIFSRMDTDMTAMNVTNAKYFTQNKYLMMNLWGELITPIYFAKGKETRLPIRVSFEESHLMIVIPVCLADVQKVMRAMWLNYDHWSDQCRTYSCPSPPDHFTKNLLELFQAEFEKKKDVILYRAELKKKIKKNILGITPDTTLSRELMIWEGKPQRALSEEIAYMEWEEEEEMSMKIKDVVEEFEINLRERTIIGQILLLEILNEPPQANCMRYKHCVTLRQKPPVLEKIDFYKKCRRIKREDLEEANKAIEEIRREAYSRTDMQEMKELIEIQLKPSETVLWFEQPEVANWIPSRNIWSREDIHDLYYEEKEGTLSFSTGLLGLIGLHVGRYCLLPYEDWVFQGNDEGGVSFYLKTPKVELNFKIREGEVCLSELINVQTMLEGKALDWILEQYYDPQTLMKHLRKGGIDIFPAHDAFVYLEKILPKHIVLEKHIYEIWGIFSQSFRFKHSKFNQIAGRQNLVFQAQQVYPNHQLNYCLIQNSMCSSYVLDIDENSEKYSPIPAPAMDECIDLSSLLLKNSTGQAKRLVDITSYILVQTVQDFLTLIRPLSFSRSNNS